MLASQITSALATRRTVRVTYHRSTETSDVDVVLGEQVEFTIARGITDESRADRLGSDAAHLFDLDVSRLDVD